MYVNVWVNNCVDGVVQSYVCIKCVLMSPFIRKIVSVYQRENGFIISMELSPCVGSELFVPTFKSTAKRQCSNVNVPSSRHHNTAITSLFSHSKIKIHAIRLDSFRVYAYVCEKLQIISNSCCLATRALQFNENSFVIVYDSRANSNARNIYNYIRVHCKHHTAHAFTCIHVSHSVRRMVWNSMAVLHFFIICARK